MSTTALSDLQHLLVLVRNFADEMMMMMKTMVMMKIRTMVMMMVVVMEMLLLKASELLGGTAGMSGVLLNHHCVF